MKPRTSAPMTLDAMRAFAVAQLAHYTELVTVLDKIKVDPLSVLPQAARRPAKKRRRQQGLGPAAIHAAGRRHAAPTHTAAKAYAQGAVAKLGLATVREIVVWAKKKGWGTVSEHPDAVMAIELKKLVTAGVLRRRTGPGKAVRYALAVPSKKNATKLATAQALLNGQPATALAPVTPSEAVN